LGVEVCFVTPAWDLITAGNWADRWDLSVGSMTVTPERAKVLYFAQPYYTTPAALICTQIDTIYAAASRSGGKQIGVCGGCTMRASERSLVIPGETIDFVIRTP
jgi:polar amino acid transport system substrate-binding protein